MRHVGVMMATSKVPHNDFAEGFIVGYQLIRGINASTPGRPSQPSTSGSSTPFLDGIKAGIKAAGATLR
jgi:hypothetical protein